MQQRSLSIVSIQTAQSGAAASWTNIPQFVITVPEDGDYDIKSLCTLDTTATAAGEINIRIAINGNPVPGGITRSYQQQTAARQFCPASIVLFGVSLKASDVVSLQSYYSGVQGSVFYDSVGSVGSLQVIKRGL